METVYTQDEIDRAFADMDILLGNTVDVATGECADRRCAHCGATELLRNDGSESVCADCGVVQPGIQLAAEYYYPFLRQSNYKPIHHWHERISQFLLLESEIPHEHFELIKARLCDGTYTYLNKDCIRTVLRSLKLQVYIEKWLQIIHRITGIRPPIPGTLLVKQLDELFMQLQVPFQLFKWEKRKNFLNYNYVFCRLFQKLNCTKFCMFFPLINSKQKLTLLDETYTQMASYLQWEVPTLQRVPEFAVRLERSLIERPLPDVECAAAAPVARLATPRRKLFRVSDRYLLERLSKRPRQRRLSPSAPAPQTGGT